MVWPIIAAGVAAGVSVVGSLYSASKSSEGAEAAKEAGRMSARFIREETEETLRRQRISDTMERGQGEATLAAAGLRGTGSAGDYLDFLQAERRKTNAWTMRSGMLKAQAARAGANIVASGLESEGRLYALQAVGQVANAIDRGLGGAKKPPGQKPVPSTSTSSVTRVG